MDEKDEKQIEPKQLNKQLPDRSALKKLVPIKKLINKTTPQDKDLVDDLPLQKTLKEEVPQSGDRKNMVLIDGLYVLIFPTKLLYFRNRTTSIYKILKILPIGDFLAYEKGTFDQERDSDQILFDFLIAVFDDVKFVRKHYNNIDAATIDKILEIFGRINNIEDKELAARKNREAQASAKKNP